MWIQGVSEKISPFLHTSNRRHGNKQFSLSNLCLADIVDCWLIYDVLFQNFLFKSRIRGCDINVGRVRMWFKYDFPFVCESLPLKATTESQNISKYCSKTAEHW